MFRKLVLALTGVGAAGVVVVFVLTILLLRRLPKQRRVAMDGVTTIDDECTGLFANIKRFPEGGRALDGVIERNGHYYNPFYEGLLSS